MSEKMRLTAHNGRAGKNGTYSAKHNDRNFDTREAEHIDEERSLDNWYWHCFQHSKPEMTFEDAEARYYEKHFREALDERNQRSIAQRHPERVKTMDDYRKSQKSCPEEQIMQIGHKDMSVDPDTLKKIAIAQITWEQKQFPNFRLLDVALHVDEEGAPHIHKRGVWVAHDDAGREIVGQAKALAEMGVQAPEPYEKYGKYNNAKITHTRACREHLAHLCHEHGLDLELSPKEHSKTGLALEEYKAQQEIAKQLEAQKAVEQAQARIEELEKTLADRKEMAALLKDLNKSIKAAGAIGHRVATEDDLTLKKPLFGKNNEVSLGSVQMASYELEREFKEIKPIVKNLQKVEKSLTTMQTNEKQLIEDRAQELVNQLHAQLQRDAQQAKKEREEAEKLKAEYQEYRDNEKSYILGTAEKKAQEMFEKSDISPSKYKRIAKFLDNITYDDGTSVLDEWLKKERQHERSLGFDR